MTFVGFSVVPAVTAIPTPIDPVAEQDEMRYAVGFYGVPRDLEVGDEYEGGRVVMIDRVLHFAAIQTTSPLSFEMRALLDDNVRYVEPDPEMQLIMFTPNDPRYGSMYGPQQVGAPAAWDKTLGSSSVVVCVADTGVRYTHEDLTGSRWGGGYNFISNTNDPWDDNGHGTHVTGTAAAGTNNGKGIAGIAQVTFKHAKVLNSAGGGTWTQVASGIRWCADNGAHVVSLSLGASSGATALHDAVKYADGKGALVVAAAGNSGPCTNCISYPARYVEAVAVTCTTASKSLCSFSSTGPEAELAAPGSGIDSTWHSSNTAYLSISGTSMSTPHVSGVAGLLKSWEPSLSKQQMRDRLTSTAEDLGASGRDANFGFGLVRADLALGSGGGTPPPSETLVYGMNFNNGASGWTKSSSSALWRLSSGCLGGVGSSTSLQMNRADTACNYDTGTRVDDWVQSPNVGLSGMSSATLKFTHRWTTESYSGGAYDIQRVQVSSNGGSSWSTLAQWDSRDPNQSSWKTESFDVSSWAGTSGFRVRFHFDTVDGVSNNYAGWAIDDFEVWAK